MHDFCFLFFLNLFLSKNMSTSVQARNFNFITSENIINHIIIPPPLFSPTFSSLMSFTQNEFEFQFARFFREFAQHCIKPICLTICSNTLKNLRLEALFFNFFTSRETRSQSVLKVFSRSHITKLPFDRQNFLGHHQIWLRLEIQNFGKKKYAS